MKYDFLWWCNIFSPEKTVVVTKNKFTRKPHTYTSHKTSNMARRSNLLNISFLTGQKAVDISSYAKHHSAFMSLHIHKRAAEIEVKIQSKLIPPLKTLHNCVINV